MLGGLGSWAKTAVAQLAVGTAVIRLWDMRDVGTM